jgi:acyl-coenzyme A thioesterase PaaI-like protein
MQRLAAKVVTGAAGIFGVNAIMCGPVEVPSDWHAMPFPGDVHDVSYHWLYNTAMKDREAGLKYMDVFISPDRQRIVAFVECGDATCGHPKFVHGGCSAALVDDACGSLFFASGIGNGFTAKLETNYRRPMPTHTRVAIKGHVRSVEGRKVWIDAEVVNASDDREKYIDASALFVTKKVDSQPVSLTVAQEKFSKTQAKL